MGGCVSPFRKFKLDSARIPIVTQSLPCPNSPDSIFPQLSLHLHLLAFLLVFYMTALWCHPPPNFCMHLLFTSSVTSTNRDPSEMFTTKPYVKSVLEKSMCCVKESNFYHLVKSDVWCCLASVSLKQSLYALILVSARSKAWFCCSTIIGNAGSISAESMDVCLLWVLCVVLVPTSVTGRSLVQGSPDGWVWVCACV
jgi:hypothetical protein